jgi:hypothetical protein
MTLTIAGLASALRPDDAELRVNETKTVVWIAGIRGHVRSDLTMHLAMSRLSPAAKEAAADLFEAGCIDSHASGVPFVARLPADAAERVLMRTALGLRPKETLSRPQKVGLDTTNLKGRMPPTSKPSSMA